LSHVERDDCRERQQGGRRLEDEFGFHGFLGFEDLN
jgi:hypothetical protein